MITEGIYHNPNTGQDEVRCIRCDASGHLKGAPSRFFTYSIGALSANGSVATSVIDLGEENSYTELIARKTGVASNNEVIAIHTSIDGVHWGAAANIHANGVAAGKLVNSGRHHYVKCRPIGRFARILYRNGDTAQTNLVLELAAFAGV